MVHLAAGICDRLVTTQAAYPHGFLKQHRAILRAGESVYAVTNTFWKIGVRHSACLSVVPRTTRI